MKILAIDTTSATGSASLLEDRVVLGTAQASPAEPYSAWLHREVERLLHAAGFAQPQVELYAVAAGPGSFTGVRVGLAAVKAWTEVYRRPIAAVSALEALASQESGHAPLVAGIADAHRGECFAGLYHQAAGLLRRRGEDVVASPVECLAYLSEQAGGCEYVIRTTASELLREAVNSAGPRAPRVVAADPVLAPWIGQLGFARAGRGELGDALTVDAHYVRRSDAEIRWKAR